MKTLYERARSGLLSNLIETESGIYLPAGPNQFRTLWTRDFCLSVPGLLALGRSDVVRAQLKLLWSFQREDGLLPRGVDVVNPKLRVLANVVPGGKALLGLPAFDYKKKAFTPEYLGEHGTPCIDSNVLVLWATALLGENPGGNSHLALSWYKNYLSAGAIHQPAFSDWQDSLPRTGPQLYTHLLLRKALKLNPILSWDLSVLEKIIRNSFLDDSLWRFQSFESLLWVLEDPLPGFKFTPEMLLEVYPLAQWGRPNRVRQKPSWTTRLVGLSEYHLQLRWSWLMAEGARVLHPQRPDWSRMVFQELDKLSARSGAVGEIYEGDVEFNGIFYKSESPFSWGSAKVIEALSASGFSV